MIRALFGSARFLTNKDTAAGIVCLTKENKDKPWILFETGALTKGLSTNRVCTLLIDLSPSDIEDPLAQFNHTLPIRDDMWGLIYSLNNCLESRLEEKILKQVFETYWPQFEGKFKLALESNPSTVTLKPRKEIEVLSEILENTRSLSNRVRNLESQLPKPEARTITAHSITPPSIRLSLNSQIEAMAKLGYTKEKTREIFIVQGHPPHIISSVLDNGGIDFPADRN